MESAQFSSTRWWRATIEKIEPHICIHSVVSTFIITACIIYDTSYGLEREVSEDYFIHGNFVRKTLSDGSTELEW